MEASEPLKRLLHGVKDAVDPEDDPLKIVQIRYAKGEISRDEYEEMKKALRVTLASLRAAPQSI